jgi:hypothetical protein
VRAADHKENPTLKTLILAAAAVAALTTPTLASPYGNLTDEQLIRHEDRLDDISVGADR